MNDYIIKQATENAHLFKDDFIKWLSENMHIYLTFELNALLMIKKGRTHYSARTIVEYMRHDTAIREQKSPFKIQNNVIPDLARFFAIRHNAYKNLFDFRITKERTERVV